jgi:apolipoprotein N-acyltransferase
VSGLTFLMVFTVAAAIETIRTGRWRRLFPAAAPAVTTLMGPGPGVSHHTGRDDAGRGGAEQRPVRVLRPAHRGGDRPGAGATGPVLGRGCGIWRWPEGLDADLFQTPWLAEYLTGISTGQVPTL